MARKRARLRGKCNLLFSSARSRKLQRRFAAGQKNFIFAVCQRTQKSKVYKRKLNKKQ